MYPCKKKIVFDFEEIEEGVNYSSCAPSETMSKNENKNTEHYHILSKKHFEWFTFLHTHISKKNPYFSLALPNIIVPESLLHPTPTTSTAIIQKEFGEFVTLIFPSSVKSNFKESDCPSFGNYIYGDH